MLPEVRTTDGKRRFQIEKLEERIAPCGCNPCHKNPCHRSCGGCGETEIEVNFSFELELGGLCI